MSAILVLIHALVSIALVLAVTHQAIALWPAPRTAGGSLLRQLRGVDGGHYTHAVIWLYLGNFVLGAALYGPYRLEVRPLLEDLYLLAPAGMFETKEHLAALGLGLLPAYWVAWRSREGSPLVGSDAAPLARRAVTLLLAFFVWFSLLAGHIVGNIKGV